MLQILQSLCSSTPPTVIEGFPEQITWSDFCTFFQNFQQNLIGSRKSCVYQTPVEKSSLGNYIKSFEPIVIAALRVNN